MIPVGKRLVFCGGTREYLPTWRFPGAELDPLCHSMPFVRPRDLTNVRAQTRYLLQMTSGTFHSRSNVVHRLKAMNPDASLVARTSGINHGTQRGASEGIFQVEELITGIGSELTPYLLPNASEQTISNIKSARSTPILASMHFEGHWPRKWEAFQSFNLSNSLNGPMPGNSKHGNGGKHATRDYYSGVYHDTGLRPGQVNNITASCIQKEVRPTLFAHIQRHTLTHISQQGDDPHPLWRTVSTCFPQLFIDITGRRYSTT
ncbi:hypothetical protein AG1IA_08044 [Rhizoctonia solani AG-1 IA]|uniref:Uncharacterized protein n=1 Tax=Thanatephorus cucumeris (strain AG1-IA) TaxID=983506 RepID=L8WI95_THACA|nr:hypothetical protein AG1IA_08044 [Rhizoctonia solani AG-1 IA]